MLYVIITLISAIFLVYQYGSWNRNYWRIRNVPCTETWAFVGDLKDVLLGKKHIGSAYIDIYEKFKGCRYVGIYDMRTPAILIRDPELVKDILQKEFYTFSVNNFNIIGDLDRLLAHNTFFRNGEEWKTTRSHMSQHMTSSKIKLMVPHMDAIAHTMVEYLNARLLQDIECKNSVNVDLIIGRPYWRSKFKLVSRYTTDVIASAILGLSSNSFLDTPSLFFEVTQSIFDGDYSFWSELKKFFFFTAPELGKLLRVSPRGSTHPPTVHIAAEIYGFFLDGFETSSAAISVTLFELASNFNIQDRARNEITDVLEKHNGTITYDNMAELQYLDMIISESLRRYSPQVLLQKKSTARYMLPPSRPGLKPLTIEKGTRIVIPTLALHLDAEFFPEPENFDPERFNEQNKGSINRFVYCPFGEGPRICIGMKLAMAQMKVALARIIENFEIRLSPKCPKKPLIVDAKFLIMRPLGGIWLTFHKIDKK